MARTACFGLLAGLLVCFFHQGRGWNANSRLLTVFGLVEEGTLHADRWKSETGDYAEINGHVYSDKAPLSSLVVLPFYWALRRIEGGPQSPQDRERANHIGVVVACAVPFAMCSILLLGRLRRDGAAPTTAVWMAGTAAFGTCLADYGGCYFGHMLATALFLGSYALACDREECFAAAGALGGLSVLADYSLALTQVLIFVYLLLGPNRERRALPYALGAAPAAVALFGYNKLITGYWLDFPYSHVPERWAPMRHDFGLRLPSTEAAWQLAFGHWRGLSTYAPILLLAIPAMAVAFRGPRRRRILALTLIGSHFVVISSYFKWSGGDCVGPRHLAPLIALGLYEGTAALAGTNRLRAAYFVLAAGGGLISLVASATTSLPREAFHVPVFEVFIPKLLAGDISRHNLPAELVGLPNGSYLVAVWLMLFLGFMWLTGRWFARTAERDRGGDPSGPAAPPR